jgi:hypothetical protein
MNHDDVIADWLPHLFIDLNVLKEVVSDVTKCILWPREEPID